MDRLLPKHDVLPLPWPPLAVVASGFSICALIWQFKPWTKTK
jgi:hypothetical protein